MLDIRTQYPMLMAAEPQPMLATRRRPRRFASSAVPRVTQEAGLDPARFDRIEIAVGPRTTRRTALGTRTIDRPSEGVMR